MLAKGTGAEVLSPRRGHEATSGSCSWRGATNELVESVGAASCRRMVIRIRCAAHSGAVFERGRKNADGRGRGVSASSSALADEC